MMPIPQEEDEVMQQSVQKQNQRHGSCSRADIELRALRSIPGSLGGLVSKEFTSNMTFEIRPAPDLVLKKAVKFFIQLPKEYPGRAPTVRSKGSFVEALPTNWEPPASDNGQQDCILIDPTGNWQLPFLDERSQSGWSRSYDLAVLFYALRRAFLLPDTKSYAWFPPPPSQRPFSKCLQHQFKIDASGNHHHVLVGNTRHMSVSSINSSSSNETQASLVLVAAEASTRGRRREMEDVTTIHINSKLNNGKQVSLVCLFDGHGGRGCAAWAGEHLPKRILDKASAELDWRKALWDAFREADREWLQRVMTNQQHISSSSESKEKAAKLALRVKYPHLPRGVTAVAVSTAIEQHSDISGCTAMAVLFDASTNRLFVANLGDCRCVLARRDTAGTLRAHELSFDARADRPDEIARVCAAGAFVANKRVNGQLAVSRALGDIVYKRPTLDSSGTAPVASEPDVTEVQLKYLDEFILLACDGLWDVLDPQAAIDFVSAHMVQAAANGEALNHVCEKLVRHAVDDRKSTDNVSVAIILLTKPGTKPALPAGPHAKMQQAPPFTMTSSPGLFSAFSATNRTASASSLSSRGSTPSNSNNHARGIGAILRGTRNGTKDNGTPRVDDTSFFGSFAPSSSRNKLFTSGSTSLLGISRPQPSTSPTKPPPPKRPAPDDEEALMEFLLDDNNFDSVVAKK